MRVNNWKVFILSIKLSACTHYAHRMSFHCNRMDQKRFIMWIKAYFQHSSSETWSPWALNEHGEKVRARIIMPHTAPISKFTAFTQIFTWTFSWSHHLGPALREAGEIQIRPTVKQTEEQTCTAKRCWTLVYCLLMESHQPILRWDVHLEQQWSTANCTIPPLTCEQITSTLDDKENLSHNPLSYR